MATHSTKTLRPAGLVLALFLVLPPALHADPGTIQPQAMQQILTLVQEKTSRTPAQKKLASPLLLELAFERGTLSRQALPALRTGLERRGERVLVDLDAEVDGELLHRIEELGGEVVSAFPRYRAVRAELPWGALEALAASPRVGSVRPADTYRRNMTNTTEGDVAHGTDTFRTDTGADGSGVMACAMSDSVDALAALQASGDLPPGVTVLPGQSGNPGSSEGTALLEIIHDMAPGADLAFATGAGGLAQMAQNILDLADIGCDIIVDDVLYFAEGVFQDDIIAQAVDQVVADGVRYFSSAGNSGNFDSGTSGTWEGQYSATALPGPLTGAGLSAHDFGAGNSNLITTDGPSFFTLHWASPLNAAADDYDLYLLDNALANVLGASTATQDGTQDPFEAIDTQADDDTNNRLVVVKFAGDDVFLHVSAQRGQLDQATPGEIYGHPAAAGAFAIAAVNVATAGGGVFTGGPANPVEPFSSDGPRTIFFEPDGTPIARLPQNAEKGVSSVVRQKPDFAAADGVSTATPGFNPFFGTSASAPHAAGISALFEDLFPSVSPDNFEDLFRSGALDIDDPGFDRNSGSGLMNIEEPALNTIFSDGFESGNVTSWTNEVP
jgi:hypothetical protein